MISKQWMLFLAVALIAGLSAGVVGSVVTESYLERYTASLEQQGIPPRLSGERPREVGVSDADALTRVRDRVVPSVVMWYRALPEGSSVVKGSYVPGEAIGLGAVVSSDGWVMTTDEAVRGLSATQLIGVVGNRALVVTDLVKDPGTTSVFVKMDVSNVPVLSFADASRLQVGDSLYVMGADEAFTRVQVTSTLQEAPFLSSSDVFGGSLMVTLGGEGLPGAPVVDGAGELVGRIEDRATDTVETLEWIMPALRQVLKGEPVTRPVFGVETVMLDQAVGHAEMGVGALVVNAPAFGTPSRVAGIRVGDVLLRVGEKELSGTMTVARALLDAKAGESIAVQLKRGEETLDVDVVLDARD